MKKLISFILVAAMALSMLSGCGADKTDSKKGMTIVTTIFPEYDWVREITKGNDSVELTMLLNNGVDLHSYQPTVDDIVKVSACDVFVYVGGESDAWVEDALAEATNKDMVVINLMEVLGESVKEEELIEGMQEEEEHEHEAGKEHEDDEEEGPEYDEHVWLSVKNAKVICQYIANELIKVDAGNKELYENNVEAYFSKLDALDREYEATVNEASCKTVLFGDRFPFRYMVDDYQLNYYAAFVGCSAETEASFENIKFLADKVDELGLKAILQLERADGKLAQTIQAATRTKNQEILTMDSMQSVPAEDVREGSTYLEIMKSNLDVLRKALQ